ncbi:unnamed protein product [Spirodela intermedia]|uniref:Uncharacterized protein n=1 Tax=Spirodela intermedia TaxID=51605 RepID=A0A7I8L7U2_SPIIN|nr:unnamed protein product [Spirodela intermedia]
MSQELDGGGAHVRDFILKSAQQEEALHRIWYALRRWRLVSRRIVLFSTTACSYSQNDNLSQKYGALLRGGGPTSPYMGAHKWAKGRWACLRPSSP